MKRLVSATLALTLLGGSAAVAAPRTIMAETKDTMAAMATRIAVTITADMMVTTVAQSWPASAFWR